MSDFASVFSEVGDAVEAEQAQRALAVAKEASRGAQQFLFLASSAGEFEDRVALAEDSLSKAAVAAGVPVETLVEAHRKDFGLVLEAMTATAEKNVWGTEKSDVGEGFCPDCEREPRADGSLQHYTNCPRHKNNAKTAAGRMGATAVCPDCNGSRAVPAQGHEPHRDVSNGQVRCPTCAGHGVIQENDVDERTSYERYGDSGDYYRGDDGDAQDRWYGNDYLASASQRLAGLRTALQEGVNPLEWLEEEGAGQGQPEKPGGHTTTNEQTGPAPQVQAKVANAYEPGSVSDECLDDGVGCDGGDCDCHCHGASAPNFRTDADVAKYHADDPHSYYKLLRDQHGDWDEHPQRREASKAAVPPFGREALWGRGKAPAAPVEQVDPLAGREQCPCGSRMTKQLPGREQHKCWNCDGVFTPKTASGLGMPPGGMAPQTIVPKTEGEGIPGMGRGPVPTNQSTTKPRQMPGGQVGSGADVGMDPISNGTDVGNEGSDGANGVPPIQASASPYVMADLMESIRTDNPGLDQGSVYALAKAASDQYGLGRKQAETWSPLQYGNRAPLPPSRTKGPKGKPAAPGRPAGGQVPSNSPSRLQVTRQKEHAQNVLGPAPAKQVGPAPLKGLPRGKDPLDSLDFLMNDEEEARNQDIKMRQGEDGIWRYTGKVHA